MPSRSGKPYSDYTLSCTLSPRTLVWQMTPVLGSTLFVMAFEILGDIAGSATRGARRKNRKNQTTRVVLRFAREQSPNFDKVYSDLFTIMNHYSDVNWLDEEEACRIWNDKSILSVERSALGRSTRSPGHSPLNGSGLSCPKHLKVQQPIPETMDTLTLSRKKLARLRFKKTTPTNTLPSPSSSPEIESLDGSIDDALTSLYPRCVTRW